MLVINYSGLTSAESISAGASIGSVVSEPTTAAPVAAQSFPGPSTLQAVTVILPEPEQQDDGIYTTSIDISGQNLEDVTSVSVAGKLYPIDITNNQSAGTFNYSPDTGTLTIYSSTPFPAGAISTVTGLNPYAAPAPSLGQFTTEYPTNVLPGPHPEFLSRWDIVGQLQIDRNIKSFPTAQFTIIAHKSQKSEIMAFFKPKQKLSLYGCYFECSKPAISEKPRDEFLTISVQLRGGWEREATDPVRLISRDAENVTRTYLKTICYRAGIPYSGPNIRINVPKGTTKSASTTVMGEIGSRAIVENCFPFLSSAEGIELRRYGGAREEPIYRFLGRHRFQVGTQTIPATTKTHILSRSDIWSDIGHSMPGTGPEVNGVPLVAEWKNMEVQLSPAIEIAENITEAIESGHTKPTEPYKRLSLRRGTAVESNVSMEMRESNVWWPNGPSKNWRRTIMLNNSPTEEEEFTYALVGSPLSVYQVYGWDFGAWEDRYRNRSAYDFWKLVKYVRNTYEYDDDGWLIKVRSKGWQYMNFSASGDLLELRKQYADEEGGDGAILRSLYNQIMLAQFRQPSALSDTPYDPSTNAPLWQNLDLAQSSMNHKVPVNEITTYTLARFRDYYPDMQCRADDPDYVEPLFCIEEERISEDMAFAPDPRDVEAEDYKRSPKVTGQRRVERKTIEIIYPEARTQFRNWHKNREKFCTINYSSNYVGGDLSNSSVEETYSISLGRPSVHTRRQKYKNTWISESSVSPDSNRRIIFNTPNSGYGFGDLENGPITFPDVFSISKAVQAAKNKINEDNLGAYTISFDVNPRAADSWEEGDLIQYDGKTWVLMSISQSRTIESRGRITSNGWPVTLALMLNCKASYVTRECKI